MFALQIQGLNKQILITADEFKLTVDRQYVYFYKDNKKVGLINMENVRSIIDVYSVNDMK